MQRDQECVPLPADGVLGSLHVLGALGGAVRTPLARLASCTALAEERLGKWEHMRRGEGFMQTWEGCSFPSGSAGQPRACKGAAWALPAFVVWWCS